MPKLPGVVDGIQTPGLPGDPERVALTQLRVELPDPTPPAGPTPPAEPTPMTVTAPATGPATLTVRMALTVQTPLTSRMPLTITMLIALGIAVGGGVPYGETDPRGPGSVGRDTGEAAEPDAAITGHQAPGHPDLRGDVHTAARLRRAWRTRAAERPRRGLPARAVDPRTPTGCGV